MKSLSAKKIAAAALALLLFGNSFAITNAIKIKIEKGSYSDETVIRFLSDATTGFDGSYDAWKLFSSNTAVPNIFTKTSDGDPLAINALPGLSSSQSVDVFLKINTAGTFTISAEELGAFDSSVCIMMKDLSTGSLYYLRSTSPYIIALPAIAQTASARFRVFFSYPATVQTSDASCAACNDGQVTLNKAGETNWQYQIISSSSDTVDSGIASASVAISNLASGNYTVTINSDYTCSESKSFFIGPVTYYTRMSGNWEDASTWSTAGCAGVVSVTVPSSTDNVVICEGKTVTVNTVLNLKEITINGGLYLNTNVNLSGDFTNNGFFSPGNNTVTFTGNRTQHISGSSNTTFGTMAINNSTPSNAVVLLAPVTVNDTLKLMDGHLLTTSENILTLSGDAIVALKAVPQDSSFVKGPMMNTVNTTLGVTKIFPVGKDNSYRRLDLIITQKTSTTTTYTAEMMNNSAMSLGYSLPTNFTNVSYVRYHQITQSPATTLLKSAYVRLYFNCQGGDDEVENVGGISVGQNNGTLWKDLGDVASAYLCTGSSYWGSTRSNTFTSFSGNKFVLANTGTPSGLAVTLSQFSAVAKNKSVHIFWKTSTETNCDHFVVEHSFDGEEFTPIGFVNGNGNSATDKFYSAVDSAPYPTISYYRLKQVDFNGASWYSEVVSVRMDENSFTAVYPNPASDYCNIMIDRSKDIATDIAFYDILGNKVLTRQVTPFSDNELIQIDLKEKIAPGLYFLAVTNTRINSSNKIIIK